MERLMGRNKELVIAGMRIVFLDGFVPRHDVLAFVQCVLASGAKQSRTAPKSPKGDLQSVPT